MSQLAEKFRWTVDRYHRAVETGFLSPDSRFELIDGELIAVVPPNPPHVLLVTRLDRHFQATVDRDAHVVLVQQPLALDPESHPEPDLMIVRGPLDRYGQHLPSAHDVILLVEVADTTVRHDRDVKLPLYARHGLGEVWVVDVRGQTVEVHRSPTTTGYAYVETVTEGIVSAKALGVELPVEGLFAAL